MAQQHNNRNSPHLNHLQQNGSAPSSPSMSGSQQGNQRQPVSYPSPTAYPSPSLPASQQYSYPAPGSQTEPYRASPTGSNGSLSLPSMRSLDPLQQQQQRQQEQAAQHQMNSPLPPPVAQMGGPYYQNQLPHPSQQQHQYPNVTSDPNMRYALPADARVMSGGRHKKVRFIVNYRFDRAIALFEYRVSHHTNVSNFSIRRLNVEQKRVA